MFALFLLALALPQVTVALGSTPPSLDPNADAVSWGTTTIAKLTWDVQSARPMHEDTIARVTTDGKYLYVRFDAAQKEPIISAQRTNDVGQGTDDTVWVDVWPTGPAGYQYQFAATPNGTHYQSSTENTNFAPRWDSYGVIRRGGYTVTMKIPLSVIRGAQNRNSWRMQFVRYVRSTGQQAVWSYDPSQTSPDDPARAGTMTIAQPKPQTAHARVSAYTLTRLGSEGAGGNALRSGLDLSVPLTPQTSFYATFYPDASNVELDQQTITPTVYPRSFVEVRPFFTQGSSNFNQFGCNFCNGLSVLYTPAIPTPRSGYAIEGKSGAFSFTGFDAVGYGRQDAAQALMYVSNDARWIGSLNHVAVDLPGFKDDEVVSGLYYNDLKHWQLYANYGSDSGTNVLQGNRAQYYDTGVLWASSTFSAWGGVHRIGTYFNPVDAFILKSGANGWGSYANKIWTFAPNDMFSAVSLGGALTRNHGDDGPLDQTGNKLNLDFLTRNAIDINVSSGSSYLLLSNGIFTPISQTGGFAITYHSGAQTNNPISFDAHGPSSTPTKLQYNTGKYGDGRLDTWIRSSTVRVGARGTLNVQIDNTAQYFPSQAPLVQWFDSVGYAYQIDRDSSLAIGLRRIIGAPPVPNGGGGCAGVCSNVTLAYHSRMAHSELYFAYGDPNALLTVSQVILKLIFYAGADKGT